jgi:hypothetical protein
MTGTHDQAVDELAALATASLIHSLGCHKAGELTLRCRCLKEEAGRNVRGSKRGVLAAEGAVIRPGSHLILADP